ncbi:hypothetical protein ADINL_1811 [Nitrincola lacisaponensis]|uniref:Metallo-beta-lactamase domain-containing protein n=1 Tax=Nitrincola lacisaponensis TaxID=267850 RepID=A0A063Y4S1_9GAMM|nr:MBL fold metallo-hydrolase [Nitrincola lacisaponensis]KDE39771.1 hypothetical protein ADINL_1811 [Nitrincola lacisaponensis]
MKKHILTYSVFAALCLTAAHAEPLDPQALAEQGIQAGQHYPGLLNLCDLTIPLRTAGNRPANLVNERSTQQRVRSLPEPIPTQVFDNLYFVGHAGVSSWALTTDEGIIIIDALNNNEEAQRYIEEGLVTLGLDPADIKYLVITHGHGDHYGGQEYIVTEYGARVVMSETEWLMLELDGVNTRNPRWGTPPHRDISVQDGHVLDLGDQQLYLYLTPGHTPGTLSLIFPVKDGNTTHYVALWGGTGFNFGPNIQRFEQYSASASRFRELAEKHNVDIFLSNHSSRDNTLERIKLLTQSRPDGIHPFVDANALDVFKLFEYCSLAHAKNLQLTQAER